MEHASEGLGEDISDIVSGGNMLERYLSLLDTLANVVVSYVDMLRTLVALRRQCERNRRSIVCKQSGGEWLIQTYLPQKRMQPQCGPR